MSKYSFGRRADAQRMAEHQEQLHREADKHAEGNGGFKLRKGDNLFWIMPPLLDETPEPFRSLRVHYNPFSVCGGHPAVLQETEDGFRVKHVARVKECLRCELDWDDFGYNAKGGEPEKLKWKKSARYAQFEKMKAMDKVLFVAFPMNDLYSVQKTKKGMKTIQTLVQKENAARKFGVLMRKYQEFTQTDEFQKSIENGLERPAMLRFKPKNEDQDVEFGVLPILFSLASWYKFVYPQISDAVLEGVTPWGIDDNGKIPAILNIVRTGTDRESTSYSGSVLIAPEDERLEISEDFLTNVLQKYVPDVSQIFLMPDDEKVRADRAEYLKSLKDASNDFSDDDDELPPAQTAKTEKTQEQKRSDNRFGKTTSVKTAASEDDFDDDGLTDDADVSVDEEEF